MAGGGSVPWELSPGLGASWQEVPNIIFTSTVVGPRHLHVRRTDNRRGIAASLKSRSPGSVCRTPACSRADPEPDGLHSKCQGLRSVLSLSYTTTACFLCSLGRERAHNQVSGQGSGRNFCDCTGPMQDHLSVSDTRSPYRRGRRSGAHRAGWLS